MSQKIGDTSILDIAADTVDGIIEIHSQEALKRNTGTCGRPF